MSLRLTECLAGFLFLMALSATGCGVGGPPLGTVTGMVTLDGKPLAGVSVQFDPGHIRPASGVTDNEGRYSLSFLPGTEGAPLGKNTVRIYPQTTDSAGDDLPDSQIVPIPARYNEKSELWVEVTAGVNSFDFDLESQ